MAAGQASTVKRIHAVIAGRVQGVGYRAATLREAIRLGVVGWVANRADGAVELEAEGAPAAIAALVAWCHRGPRHAEVTAVEVSPQPPRGDATGFTVAADR